MTTNAGASDAQRAAIGFGSTKREGDEIEAINKLFTPEFRNRLDAIIPFSSLPMSVVHKVVQKFVMQLESQLAERHVTFELTDEATQWLSEKGYDDKMGARPLGRIIQENIKKPLAEEILFGKLKKGGIVRVSVGTKADGKQGILLETLPENVPVRPKDEAEVAATSKAPRKAKAEPVAAIAAEPSNDGAAPASGPKAPKVVAAKVVKPKVIVATPKPRAKEPKKTD
jgi:ATP-dependent Clp protease ATP-binding subunit ClpA